MVVRLLVLDTEVTTNIRIPFLFVACPVHPAEQYATFTFAWTTAIGSMVNDKLTYARHAIHNACPTAMSVKSCLPLTLCARSELVAYKLTHAAYNNNERIDIHPRATYCWPQACRKHGLRVLIHVSNHGSGSMVTKTKELDNKNNYFHVFNTWLLRALTCTFSCFW